MAGEHLKTYKGNCHCGAFKFRLLVPDLSLSSVTECNCSICFRKAYKHVFPDPEHFVIEKGEGRLETYSVGDGGVHYFCPICGTGIMVLGKRHGRAGAEISVNARALQGIDLWSLEIEKYDGAAMEPAYKSPRFNGPEPEAQIEGARLYTGSCHCGAVTMALKTRGELRAEEEVIGECDCSICARKGTIVTYRPHNQIAMVLAEGVELGSYAFASKRFEHKFCPICGVSVGVEDVVDMQRAVNLRCFEIGDEEWEGIRGRLWRERDSRLEEPVYVVPE